MTNATPANFAAGKQYAATLVRSERITPSNSTEDVRHLVFRRDDLSFSCKTGQCVRVMAPGQYCHLAQLEQGLGRQPLCRGARGGLARARAHTSFRLKRHAASETMTMAYPTRITAHIHSSLKPSPRMNMPREMGKKYVSGAR